MSISAKTRALAVCCSLAAGFTVFSYRLLHLQVTLHDHYSAIADEIHGLKRELYARRGAIMDVHGVPLALSEPVKTVVADGAIIKNPAKLAKVLAGPLEMTEDEILEKLGRRKISSKTNLEIAVRHIVLKRGLAESEAVKLAELLADPKLDEHSIFFEQDSVRSYPNGELACHVIGSVNYEKEGVEGIERSMDSQLRGVDGYRHSERDRMGREMGLFDATERAPQHGNNVTLTIDSKLQMIVESELDAAVKKYRPKWATVIMMRPQTGEILALANRPAFNLSNRKEIIGDARKHQETEDERVKREKKEGGPRTNRAIESQVEPGSTFKIVTVAAALAEHNVRPDDRIYCENGLYTYRKLPLHDHAPYQYLSVIEILAKSSNIGVAKLGIQLGEEKVHTYIRRFGFGEPSGVLLPGEATGELKPWNSWEPTAITRIPMGHSVAVSPIQLASAMCAVANGGHLMVPQIVHSINDAEGNVLQNFEPVEVRRVIPTQTAAELRSALTNVVSIKGTAAGAYVPGYKAAGKTGTAQKIENGHYISKYLVSFVGFLPAENPQFVCLVMVDEAIVDHGLNYGGTVAGPVFSIIAGQAARYLQIPATEPIDNVLLAKGAAAHD